MLPPVPSRFSGIALTLAAGLLLEQSALDSTQLPSQASQEPANLAYINATVTDSNGKAVTDLKLGEFFVREDGVRRRVASVERVSAGERRIVFVIDGCGSNEIDVLGSVGPGTYLDGFLDRAMGPGDLAAMLPVKEGSAGGLERLTGDKRLLASAVARAAGRGRLEHACDPQADRTRATGGGSGHGSAWRNGWGQPEVAGTATYDAVDAALEGLGAVAGDKYLVVLSGFVGWGDFSATGPEIQHLIERAKGAAAAVYVLDMWPPASGGPRNTWLAGRQAHLSGVKRLAEDSGGFHLRVQAVASRKPQEYKASLRRGVEAGLDRVAGDIAGRYRIGYQSAGPSPAGAARRVEVIAGREGLKTRSWAVGGPGEAPSPVSASFREDPLQAALRSPFGGADIRVRVTPFYSADENWAPTIAPPSHSLDRGI